MDKQLKGYALEHCSVGLKEVATGNFRPATDAELAACDVDAAFIQKYDAKTKEFCRDGFISYFKNPKRVITYRCQKILNGNTGNIYVTGDLLPMRLNGGNKPIQQATEGWSLHELVLLLYLKYKCSKQSTDYQSYIFWLSNPEAEINHKNGNRRTQSVYELEVCSHDENIKHGQRMTSIRNRVKRLVIECGLSRTFWEESFLGFSVNDTIDMALLEKAFEISMKEGTPTCYINTGRAMGIFA